MIYDTGFFLDARLKSSCFSLVSWPLSEVLLKNNELFPWLILVPRRQDLTDVTELTKGDRTQLMEEMHKASRVLQETYCPDKINIGALGNIVAQLHIHVVARFQNDILWPQGVWQANAPEVQYKNPKDIIDSLIVKLSA